MELSDGVPRLEWKTITEFKTVADDKSDSFIRHEIEKVFPDHCIHSEEQDPKRTSSPYQWVVDAIDGTYNYATGLTDLFAISIALCYGSKPIMGVIYAPRRKELYTAEKDRGAFLNGEPIKVNCEGNLNHVVMGLDNGKHDRLATYIPLYAKLLDEGNIGGKYSLGSGAMSLAQVACGKLIAYGATSLEPEDMAAAVILNREAGARVTSLLGIEWQLGDSSILCANPEIHAKLLARYRAQDPKLYARTLSYLRSIDPEMHTRIFQLIQNGDPALWAQLCSYLK